MPEVSAVVPVYRNADTIEELHARLTDSLRHCSTSHQLVFVNDACPDGSGIVLDRMATADRTICVHHLARNQGQASAVLAGLAQADGEMVVVLDADLQDPPEAIPLLLGELRRMGRGAVFAGRRGKYEAAGRCLTSRLFKQLIAWTCGVPKDAGSFVALSRDVAARLLEMRARRPYLLAMIGLSGCPMVSIPVERSQRPRGPSAYSAAMRLRLGLDGLATALDFKWRHR